MKKCIILFYLFLSSSDFIIAQFPVIDWVVQFGWPDTSSEFGNDIEVDSFGNVYVLGYFQGTTDFDPGAGNFPLESNGESDIYITKLDNKGNLVWAKSFGGADFDLGRSLALDTKGNIYMTGFFQWTVDFDPNPNEIYHLTAMGEEDIFILKLDNDGEFVWAKQIGGIDEDEGNSIAVDSDGDVYITGRFHETVDFDPDINEYILSSIGQDDIFIFKLNTNGDFLWANQFGGSRPERGKGIAVDGAGNVYATGRFRDTVDFDPGPDTFHLISTNSWDAYVLKLTTHGQFIWVKSFDSQNSSVGSVGQDITIDKERNVYTVGCFRSTTDFDPGINVYNLPTNGSDDIFISKLDSLGNFVWAKGFGGGTLDEGNSITLDKMGNVLTTGLFQETSDFDPGQGIFELTADDQADVFISKLSSNGNFIWAGKLGGNDTDTGFSITSDNLGNLYTTGRFRSTTDFDPNSGTQILTSLGAFDAFVHKMRQCLVNTQIESGGVTTLCPGEELFLSTSLSCPVPEASYLWTTGDTTESIFITPVVSDTYMVTVTYNSGCTASDTIAIVVEDSPEAMILEVLEACPGDTTILEATGGQDYEWSTRENMSNTIVTPTANTTYTVTITDENGCTDSDSILVEVYELPDITINGNLEVCPGDTTTLYASGGENYLWNTGQTTASILDSVFQNTVYTVTITDENGCTNTVSATVIADENFCPSCAIMPNAFTPDGDGLNDYFNVLPEGDSQVLEFRIYNRYGNLVHNNVMPWGGIYDGQPQPSDLYLYYLKVRTYCGVEELKGEVLLIR